MNEKSLDLMTPREQLLIKHAERLLGVQLSHLLMAGYSNQQDEEQRRFLLTLKEHNDEQSERQITVLTAVDSVLPRGKDTLILAALLRLFTPHYGVLGQVTFETGELLDLLGWPQKEAACAAVDVAVDRYTAMLFKSELIAGQRSGGRKLRATEMCRLFTRHSSSSEELPEGDTATRTEHTLSLLPTFAESLRKGHSVFAGVNFGRVIDLRCLPSDMALARPAISLGRNS